MLETNGLTWQNTIEERVHNDPNHGRCITHDQKSMHKSHIIAETKHQIQILRQKQQKRSILLQPRLHTHPSIPKHQIVLGAEFDSDKTYYFRCIPHVYGATKNKRNSQAQVHHRIDP